MKIFKMAEGQVRIRVCLPYMAGKISSCNIRDIITQGKYNIFSTVQIIIKAIARKHVSGTSIVHVHSTTPLAWKVKIVSFR